MKKAICLIVLVLFGSLAALSNIANPNLPKQKTKSKSVETSMKIRLDRDATEAKLLIPKSQIKQLRAELEQMDNDPDTTTTAVNSFTRTQTIVSGLLLSLAFTFGGVWFVRSGRIATKTGKTLVILAVLSGLGSAATYVYANAGPPPEARDITGKMFSQSVQIYKFGYGRIRMEIKADEGEGVELIVPDPADEKKPNGEE